MIDSPVVVLYDGNGKPFAVNNGSAIPANTPGLLAMLSDAGTARYMAGDGSGRPVVVGAGTAGTPAGGVLSVQGVSGGQNLPVQISAGTNEIGKVAQGTRAAAAGGWPEYIVDSSGNVVGVVLDGSIYRLQTDTKISKGTGTNALVHLDAIDTATGRGRLEATILTPDGDPVSFGGATSPDPSNIRNAFCLRSGSPNLAVDGSVTPAVFTYDADSTYDVSLQEVKLVIAANSITFGSNAFGSRAGPLTNGMLVEVISDGNVGTVYNLDQNESFVNFASFAGFDWVVSSKDMMFSSWQVGGGLKLHAGTSDCVRVTVRDNLTTAALYFKCFVKGNLLG